MYKVYKHQNIEIGTIYIGITKHDNVEKRWKGGMGYYENKYFFKDILYYGWKNFTHEILVDDISYDFAKIKEVEFISLYGRIIDNSGTLANLTIGGEGAKGHIVSEETRKKISNAQKGRVFTEDHRRKAVEGRRNVKLPPRTKEHQMKLDAHKIGRPLKDSTKEKLRLANIGKISARRKPVGCYDLSGNLIKKYSYVMEAAKDLGRYHCSISDAANGKTKTAYGFIWKYL
jgi:group I intron endonuclease